MKELPTYFKSGRGGFSPEQVEYVQIVREGKYAIYERRRNDKTFDYEVIIIKVLPAGTKIFNGVTEEDEEHYPGTSQWGSAGWSCVTEARAREKFQELLDLPEVTDDQPRGKRRKQRQELQYPEGEFTVKGLVPLNSDWTAGTVYIQLQKDLKEGLVKLVREESKGKGKPSKIYQRN